MKVSLLLSCMFFVAGAGCSAGRGHLDCVDRDGDGYRAGPDCDGTPDCNDDVASVHLQADCDAWCVTHPGTTDCTCDENATVHGCYLGSDETRGEGTCDDGIATCVDGVWGPCEGQVLPTEDICDGLDNDCDQAIDDADDVCGACPCEEACAGQGCGGWGEPLPPPLLETAEGLLTRDSRTSTQHVVWPASGGTSDVYRVNTETFEIEGVFWTAPPGSGEAPGARDTPNASAVDIQGNVLLLNGGGSLTKVAASPATCPDVNGNGEVDTSHAWNDKRPFEGVDDWEDECILWHASIPGDWLYARSIAIHSAVVGDGATEERAWVGLTGPQRFVEVDAETGDLTGAEARTDCQLTSAAIDRDGWLWTACLSSSIGRFDTAHPTGSFELVPKPGAFSEAQSVLVDENNTVWASGLEIFRWDREDEVFVSADVKLADGLPRSLGRLASDGEGRVWVATRGRNERVYRISNDAEMNIWGVRTPHVMGTTIAVDFDGHVWSFGGGENASASVIDLDTDRSELALNDCDSTGCLHFCDVEGDLTGLQRWNALTPPPIWTHVFEGCDAEATRWWRIAVDATLPEGGDLVVSVRTADAPGDLADEPYREVRRASDGAEMDLNAVLGTDAFANLLDVRVELESEIGGDAPVIRRVTAYRSCGAVVE